MPLSLPTNAQRHLIVGSTGSGKTVHAMHHLSMRDYDKMPWLIVDYKRDEHINSIPYAAHIEIDQVPDGPGIYIVHPMPDDNIDPLLWEVWRRGNMGLLVDEGYMLGRNNRAYRAILTQGRSKKIPLITLTQRPVWMDNFILSESEYISVFNLNFKKDRERMEEYVPFPFTEKQLPDYYSIYYYVGNRQHVDPVGPSPPMERILASFASRMKSHRERI